MMQASVDLRRGAIIALALLQAICASRAAWATGHSSSFTLFLLETTRSSCYALGDDAAGLKELAERSNWTAPSVEMLRKFEHPSYKLINGWTFEAHNRAFAVQQTEHATDRSRSCSITTKLVSEKEYEEFKSAWDRSVTVDRHDDRTTPARLFHFDAMTRPPSTSLASTLSFDRNARTFTVLITALPLNGRDPSRSGKAPSS